MHAAGQADSDEPSSPAPEAASDAAAAGKTARITLGNGCFWCTEAVFAELRGVLSAVSGYSGGQVDNPTYEAVCTGTTGHAEVVQVTYDPTIVSLPEILEVFFQTHDPTTLNRQGADVGTQYRSAVFYHDDEQRRVAQELIAKLDQSGAYDAPIVTEVTAFQKFYPAEAYHQNYFAENPRQGYCRAVIQPKMEKFRKVFREKLKTPKERRAGDQPVPVELGGGNAVGAAGEEQVDWSQVDWSKRLTREQFYVTRRGGTEPAFDNAYWNNKRKGLYRCVCCEQPLFDSSTKYDSGTGWPSFFQPVAPQAVNEHEDRGFFMVRTEIRCSRCDAHLGHVFDDGPRPTGLRYCMNSAALNFEEKASGADGSR